jgi:hypothetical protein
MKQLENSRNDQPALFLLMTKKSYAKKKRRAYNY